MRRVEQRGEVPCRLLLKASRGVTVDVHGERSVGVSQAVLYYPWVHTGSDQPCCMCVAELMQIDVDVSRADSYCSERLRQPVGIDDGADCISENQIGVDIATAKRQDALGLTCAVATQSLNGGWV